MLLVRFKVRCQPGKTQEMADAMAGVVEAARTLPGVIHFDIGRDITDPQGSRSGPEPPDRHFQASRTAYRRISK